MKKTTTVKILGALGALTVLGTGIGLTQQYTVKCPSLISGFSSISIEPAPGENPVSILLGPETEELLINICEDAVKFAGGTITSLAILTIGWFSKLIYDYFQDSPTPVVNTEYLELSVLRPNRL